MIKYTLANKTFRNILFSVIVVLGVALSIIVSASSYYADKKLLQSEFNEAAENRFSALKRELDSDLAVLPSLQALYYTSVKDIERSEFRNFTSHILKRHASIRALNWIPRVPHYRRKAYELAARTEGFHDFQFTERIAQGKMKSAERRKEYFPVYFVEPYKGSEIALGFDLASNPTRKETLEIARKTGEIRATARITLVPKGKSQFGFIVFAPIYKKGVLINSDRARWDNLEGFVLGTFRIRDIVENAMNYLKPEGVDFFIHDTTVPDKEQFLYTHSSRNRKTPLLGREQPETDVIKSKTLEVAGRKWMVIYSATPGFIAARSSWRPWGLLLAGLTFTGLVVGFLVNVSHAEDVEKSAELLKNIIEFLPDATFIIDKDKRVIAWNRAIEEMTGVLKKDIIGEDHNYLGVPFYGEPRQGLIDLVYIDNKELASKYIYVRKKMDVLYAESFAPALNHGKGAYIWVTASPLFDNNGNMIGAIESIRDISDRKRFEDALSKSEEKYRTLFEESKDAVYMSTPEGRFLDINQASVELFGYSSKEELLAIDIPNDLYFNPEDRKIFEMMVYEKGFVKDYEIEMKTKDGRKLSILSTSSVVKDEQGAIKAYRGIMHDITEHKNLQQQLHHSQKMEGIGTLAGGVAHDFNNILTAIVGYGSMAQMRLKDDTITHGYIQQILEAADSAGDLTKRLLAFSRKQVIEPVLADLNEIVRNIEKMLRRIVGEDIELSTVLSAAELPVMVDVGQMEQVLINLAANARDAMPEGGHLVIQTDTINVDSIYAEAHFFENAGMYAVLMVSDTGVGMDEWTKENMFEPFFTTKEVGKGTGLGLSMVYGIIKQHNGNINVYSVVSKGTTFKIYLPLAQTTREAMSKPIETLPEGKGETIMVAEDEPQVRKIIMTLLQENGYEIIEAKNGEEAALIFKENRGKVSLVLLDVIMPVKNGKEAYEEIKGLEPGIKTIFMSGYTDDIISKKGILEEGFDFISKPINPDTLMRKIREVLNR